LRTLGDVLCNFSKLTMKFTLNRKRVTALGKQGNNITIASSHRMERIVKKTCKALLVPNLESKVAFKGGGMIGFSRTFSKSSPWSLR
jgi:RNase P subunit RPR2